MSPKPPILSLPLRDCTAEQLASLGLGGYRLLASNGTDAVFCLQPMLDLTPPDVKAAIERANAVANGTPAATMGGSERSDVLSRLDQEVEGGRP